MRWLIQGAGFVLVAAALLDVYLTVLYARIGFAIASEALGAATWRVFRALGPAFGRYRDRFLSFCGPTILVLIILMWVGALLAGFALIVWPALGSSVQSWTGNTPTDFATALYVSGGSLTTAGAGDLLPQATFYRLLYVVMSGVGISTFTLTLTYVIQVYNALQRRNTFALNLHHATGQTGDAAELIAGLGAAGDFDSARSELSTFTTELLNYYESQHFYPILIYFRFSDISYATPRLMLLVMESASLAKTALDEQAHGAFVHSAPVTQTWNGGMHLLEDLGEVFLPKGAVEDDAVDDATARQWRRRFAAAARRLREAGIKTPGDEAAAAERYLALRRQWDAYVRGFADHMRRDMREVDRATAEAPE